MVELHFNIYIKDNDGLDEWFPWRFDADEKYNKPLDEEFEARVRYLGPHLTGGISFYTTRVENGEEVEHDVSLNSHLDEFGVGDGTVRNKKEVQLRIRLAVPNGI